MRPIELFSLTRNFWIGKKKKTLKIKANSKWINEKKNTQKGQTAHIKQSRLICMYLWFNELGFIEIILFEARRRIWQNCERSKQKKWQLESLKNELEEKPQALQQNHAWIYYHISCGTKRETRSNRNYSIF